MNLISFWSHKTIYFHLHLLSTAKKIVRIFIITLIFASIHTWRWRRRTEMKTATNRKRGKKNCYSLQLFGVFILHCDLCIPNENGQSWNKSFSPNHFSYTRYSFSVSFYRIQKHTCQRRKTPCHAGGNLTFFSCRLMWHFIAEISL